MLRLVSAAAVLAALALTGCGLGTPAANPAAENLHISLTGSVHGGQQPVAGARVFILQASNTGYGSRSVDLIAYGRPNGIVPSGLGATYDATLGAYYVTTDAAGGFSITGDYTCAGTGPVYLLATQGNPGLGSGKSNPALAELAVLGNCSTTFAPTQQVGITEVSTVTGVYALAGYMTAPNALASNGRTSTLSQTGINNATATALGLTDLASGLPLARTAAGATIPVAKVNLLADILAACINTDGTGTPCSTLFTYATADGTASGTRPTDTVTALLNLARNAGKVSIAPLYNLVTSVAPYQPYGTQPTDLALALTYPTRTTGGAQHFTQPAFDAAGRMTVSGNNGGYPTLWLFDPQGKVLGSKDIYNYDFGTQFFLPQMVALDPSNRAWLAGTEVNPSSNGFDDDYRKLRVDTISNAGFPSTTVFNNNTDTAYAIASDTSGNIYLAENHKNQLVKFDSGGSPTSTYLAGYSPAFTGLALDRFNYIYAVSSSTNTLSALSQQLSFANNFGNVPNSTTTGNLNKPSTLAVDDSTSASGYSSVWVTNAGNSSIAKFTAFNLFQNLGGSVTGFAPILSAVGTYTGGGLSFSSDTSRLIPIVVDGAASVWVPNYAGQSLSGFSTGGAALSPATYGFAAGCPAQGVAVDGSGNVWVACDANLPSMVEFIGLATPVATPILPGQLGVRP